MDQGKDLGASALKERFENLISFITTASENVQAGTITALNDLDKTVSELCADVETAPAEIAKDMQPLMAQMISKLDELAQNLTAFKEQNKKQSKAEDV